MGNRSPIGSTRSPIASTRSPRDLVNGRGADEDSDEESDSDGEDNGMEANTERWKQLCIMPQGPLYVSNSLQIDLKHEYNGASGRLMLLFRNTSSQPLNGIRVQIPDAGALRFHQDNPAPSGVPPGGTAQQVVQVQCLRPFLNPAKYLLEYSDGRGQPTRVPLMLPCVMTKFIIPQEVGLEQYRPYFESLSGPPREGQLAGQAKVPPDQWPNYLGKGFNLFVLQESSESTTMAAGTLQTATPDPAQPGKSMTVPVLVRLDFQPNGRMLRIMVRTTHGESTQSLQKIIASYLMVPPSGQS